MSNNKKPTQVDAQAKEIIEESRKQGNGKQFALWMAALVIGGVSFYHLRRVAAKNKAEMANFDKEVKLNADLGKVLVVYYSLTGHTKDIAEQISAKTGADIFEIKTVETYSSPSVYMKSKKELTSKNYPELQGNLPNVADYDTIFVGGPVWWYTMAPALYSYLQATDFNGAHVVPFSTQGSNWLKMRKFCRVKTLTILMKSIKSKYQTKSMLG